MSINKRVVGNNYKGGPTNPINCACDSYAPATESSFIAGIEFVNFGGKLEGFVYVRLLEEQRVCHQRLEVGECECRT